MAVTVYGSYNNNYYLISGYSSIATANISGNVLTVYGSSPGTANFMVCSYNNSSCGTLYVTVYTNSTYYSQYQYPDQYQYYQTPLSLSQTSLSINTGQTNAISIYGGGGYYSVRDISTPNVVSAIVSGSTLNVYGYRPGSTNVMVCQNNNNNNSCTTVYITVIGNSYYPYY
jgi:hypothetical protein